MSCLWKVFCKERLIEGPVFYYCQNEDCPSKPRNEILYYNANKEFCPKGISETTNNSPGNLQTTNDIGTSMRKIDNSTCSICGSFIVQKVFSIFGIPIIRFGRFRIRIIIKEGNIFATQSSTSFISGKIK